MPFDPHHPFHQPPTLASGKQSGSYIYGLGVFIYAFFFFKDSICK